MSHATSAYIISITFQPTASETLATMYRERTAPLIATAPGLITLLGLIQPVSGHGLSIRVWRTAIDRARSDVPSTAVVDDFAAYAPFLTGTYTRDPYDVTLNMLPTDDRARPGAAALARVTIETIRLDRWDEGIEELRTLAESDDAGLAQRAGILLFENRMIGRAILVETARSLPELEASTERMNRHDVLAYGSGYLATPTDRQVYDVVTWY